MPYIKQENRNLLDEDIYTLAMNISDQTEEYTVTETEHSQYRQRAGLLNYTITKLIKTVYGKSMNYSLYNEIIGMLECCKLEMYRRGVAEYEDVKIKENGDV